MSKDRYMDKHADRNTEKDMDKYIGEHSEKNMDKYSDIIDLPHPVSGRHPQMPLLDRAAQFSPFSALTGHDEAIEETARLTAEPPELDEGSKAVLNDRLLHIREYLRTQMSSGVSEPTPDELTAAFTYFVPDARKSGGSYQTVTGAVKKIREYEQEIVLADATIIPFKNLVSIEEMHIPINQDSV